jgi:hypothetical protein
MEIQRFTKNFNKIVTYICKEEGKPYGKNRGKDIHPYKGRVFTLIREV